VANGTNKTETSNVSPEPAATTGPKDTSGTAATGKTDTTRTPLDPNAKDQTAPQQPRVASQKEGPVKLPTADELGDTVHGVSAMPLDTDLTAEHMAYDSENHPLHGDLGVAGQVANPDDNRPGFGPNGEVPRGDSGGRELFVTPNPFNDDSDE
jgi:hypothetical protein